MLGRLVCLVGGGTYGTGETKTNGDVARMGMMW